MQRLASIAISAGAALSFCSAAYAQNYQADLAASAGLFAAKGAFAGTTLNVACRHLPAMDYIEAHKALFEDFTGAKITFTDYPENDLRSHVVSDASNKAGGFQVYCLDDNYVPLFASSQWIHPIDEAIKPDYKIDDLYSSLRNVYTWNGKLYGLPIYSEVTILYYRKDLLDAAKLTPPKTLDELATDAATLTAPPRTYGIALRGLRGEGMNVYIWSEWLRSYGGNFLDKTNKSVFNSDAGVEATQHYADLINKSGPPGSGAWGWDKVSSSFAAGRVAMIIESSAFYPTFNDPAQSSIVGKVGYQLVPAGPKGAFPANYSIGLAIPATVPADGPQMAAASAFLQWATSQQMEFARTAEGIGNEDRQSVNKSDLLRSKLDAGYIKAVADGQAITKDQYRPLIPQWREMGGLIGAEIGAVFTGSETAQAGLASAAQQVDDRFKAEGVLGSRRRYQEIFPDK